MEWDGPFESRRGVARGKSQMGLHYFGEEEGYNLCTSSNTEWDRPEEHASFRRREREVRRRVPGATAVSTDSSDFSPRSSDSEDSDPPVKDKIGGCVSCDSACHGHQSRSTPRSRPSSEKGLWETLGRRAPLLPLVGGNEPVREHWFARVESGSSPLLAGLLAESVEVGNAVVEVA